MRKTLISALLLAGAAVVARQAAVFPLLRSTVSIGKQAGGFYLLPTNQLLQPWGEVAAIAGRPVDAALSPDRRLLAVLNTRSVLLLDPSTGARLADVKANTTSYAGVAFRPDVRELWASEATRNGPDDILITELSPEGRPAKSDRLRPPGHPVPTGIAFSADGTTAYVAFSRNNTVGVIDVRSRTLKREVEVGIAPFAVVVSSKTGRVFVSNRGGRRPAAGDANAPSAGTLVAADPRTGSSVSGTVSVIDARNLAVQEVPVGLAPSGMALSPDESTLLVANGHSDSVTFLDTRTLARTEVKVPSYPEGTFGSQPVAVAFAPDSQRAFVACGGTNAIVILTGGRGKWKPAGSVPTAWFPSAVAVDGKGALKVVCIKGNGNTLGSSGTFRSVNYEGALVSVPPLQAGQMMAGEREVRTANEPKFEPAGGIANPSSLGIRHVFFIIKENRTYDQVFGDIPKGDGDPKLVMYGRDITPNHHALAERYVLLDNFHTGGAISFDGHQWLMQAFVSDYVERALAASPRGYAWNMSDSLMLSPAGFFWQSATRPVSVRLYGEFSLPARWDPATGSAVDMNESQVLPWSEYWKMYKAGKWQDVVASRCGVPALQGLFDPRYPFSNVGIPDQLRADEFLRDFSERDKNGSVAELTILHLNSDHTNGTRPGSPTPRAMVADNDLALGRIVEAISKSRLWPQSLILVVEDDAQDGVDHVDGHRTVALAIGPQVRRGATDSNHYNHGSMVRTIQEILRIPPRTRFATSARVMTSIFTRDVDNTPYQCLPEKIALDEMNPPLNALNGRRLWAARQSLAMDWSEPDDIPFDTLNQILWWDAKGYDTPYPKLKGRTR